MVGVFGINANRASVGAVLSILTIVSTFSGGAVTDKEMLEREVARKKLMIDHAENALKKGEILVSLQKKQLSVSLSGGKGT